MAKTNNSPCPPGANDKIASTGSAKLSIKTITKIKVVRHTSSKLKPRPANISRLISIAEMPTYLTPIAIAINIEQPKLFQPVGDYLKARLD